jgi:hypothetical protein
MVARTPQVGLRVASERNGRERDSHVSPYRRHSARFVVLAKLDDMRVPGSPSSTRPASMLSLWLPMWAIVARHAVETHGAALRL